MDMDTILMAVRPEWVWWIVCGIKTMEVRKNRPREVPFRVLIYCNKWGNTVYLDGKRLNGTVCAEAVVTDVFRFTSFVKDGLYRYGVPYDMMKQTMVSQDQLTSYAHGRDIFLWRMENMKIIDGKVENFGLKRVPQSWCYVQGGDKNE